MIQISNPSGKPGTSAYGGTYLTFDETGTTTVEAVSPALARWLRAAGYKVVDLAEHPEEEVVFDPADHKVEDVMSYLATADEAERARVLAAEAEGQARKSILGRADADGKADAGGEG